MKTSWQRQARRKRGLGNWKMIRFADDFVVMVAGERQHAEAPREEVSGVLATLGLRLAAEMTRVVHIDEGFDFLSITIRRMRKPGTSRHYVYTKPSRKAIQAVKDKVTAKTYRSTLHQEPAVLIQGISQTLRGWAGYHRHGVSKAVFSAVDFLCVEPDHALAAAQVPRAHRAGNARAARRYESADSCPRYGRGRPAADSG